MTEKVILKTLHDESINLGADYIINQNLSLSSSVVNGNKLGLQLNVTANPTTLSAEIS